MKSLLLDINDLEKKIIWKSFLSLFKLNIHEKKDLEYNEYDFILSDNKDILNVDFNFLLLESDEKYDNLNIKSFNKYSSKEEIVNLFDDYEGEWFELSKEEINLKMEIPYFIDIKDKKIRVDPFKYLDKSKIYTSEKYINQIKEKRFNKLLLSSNDENVLSIGTEAFLLKVKSLGLSPESIILADKIIDNSISNFNNTFFKNIINKLLTSEDYFSEFVLKSYIGSSIAKSNNFNENSISSLIKSFFFSDSINPHDKEHPIFISNQLLSIDPLCAKIILQHHERPNKKGYPNKLDSHQLEELSKIYILSECFFILLKKYNFNPLMKKKIIFILEDKFNDRYFSKYIHSLKYLFYKSR